MTGGFADSQQCSRYDHTPYVGQVVKPKLNKSELNRAGAYHVIDPTHKAFRTLMYAVSNNQKENFAATPKDVESIFKLVVCSWKLARSL